MTKARPGLVSVRLLTARGLLSLVLGAYAFSQNARSPDTLNPSPFQLQHTSWAERDGAIETLRQFYNQPNYATLYKTMRAVDPHHLYFGNWTQPRLNPTDWPIMAANPSASRKPVFV
jgi:hypothetical protein